MDRLLYRKKLLDLRNKLTESDFQQMKYLCGDIIPQARAEKTHDALDLFNRLEELDVLGPTNFQLLNKLLEWIGRGNLSYTVATNVPEEVETPDGVQCDNVIKQVFLVLAKYIGKDWKKLARYLDLEEHVIDEIEDRHKESIERGHDVLRRWRDQSKEVQVETLIKTLKLIYRYDLVDKLQKIVPPSTSLQESKGSIALSVEESKREKELVD